LAGPKYQQDVNPLHLINLMKVLINIEYQTIALVWRTCGHRLYRRSLNRGKGTPSEDTHGLQGCEGTVEDPDTSGTQHMSDCLEMNISMYRRIKDIWHHIDHSLHRLDN
jgi:hypothetical protein